MGFGNTRRFVWRRTSPHGLGDLRPGQAHAAASFPPMVLHLGSRDHPLADDCMLRGDVGPIHIRCCHPGHIKRDVWSDYFQERGRGGRRDPSHAYQTGLRAQVMTTEKPNSNRDLALYLRLFRWARPYWAHLVGLFLLSLLATPLALLAPLPLKIALDSGLGSKPFPHWIRPFMPAAFRLTPSSALLFAVGLLIAVTILAHSFFDCKILPAPPAPRVARGEKAGKIRNGSRAGSARRASRGESIWKRGKRAPSFRPSKLRRHACPAEASAGGGKVQLPGWSDLRDRNGYGTVRGIPASPVRRHQPR